MRGVGLLVLVLAAGCPGPGSADRARASSAAPSGDAGPPSPEAAAEEARRMGNLDVAATRRGELFIAHPSPAALEAWIDALVESGQPGAARAALTRVRALGDPALAEVIARREAALPPALPPLGPAGIDDDLRAAYTAEAEGRTAEAADRFRAALAAGDAHPVHLSHAAVLLWRLGDPVGARRLWARARARVREAGGAFTLVPVTTWYTDDAAWYGDRIALLRRLIPIDGWARDAQAGEWQLWSPADPRAPTLRATLPFPSAVMAFSDDRRVLLLAAEGELC
jgi:hypothetical protein